MRAALGISPQLPCEVKTSLDYTRRCLNNGRKQKETPPQDKKSSQASRQETLDKMWQRINKGQLESAALTALTTWGGLTSTAKGTCVLVPCSAAVYTPQALKRLFRTNRVRPCPYPTFQNSRGQTYGLTFGIAHSSDEQGDQLGAQDKAVEGQRTEALLHGPVFARGLVRV